jgi:hypothetical protein
MLSSIALMMDAVDAASLRSSSQACGRIAGRV